MRIPMKDRQRERKTRKHGKYDTDQKRVMVLFIQLGLNAKADALSSWLTGEEGGCD
jgi:hypothetical protein